MRNDSDNLVDAGRRQATPVYTTEERDGIPFLVTPDGVASLEQFCLRPIRRRGVVTIDTFNDAKDFIAKHRTPESAVFWMKDFFGKNGDAEAILDFHGANGEPGFCEFVVRFRCTLVELKSLNAIPTFQGSYE